MVSGMIRVNGARQHNLKNVDVEIPRDKLVVITGLSGSGKSSLAFDTIYAEGQRRYVESLSSYARQFLGQMDKPDVDLIEGLTPAIAIDQKTTSRNPRSTVGTVTEIHDYLRLLYARVGHPHCPECGRPIKHQTVQEIVDQIMNLGEGTKILVLAPIIRGRKGENKKLFQELVKDGYARVKVDGVVRELTETIEIEKTKTHDISLVVDRLVINSDIRLRLTDSVETALKKAEGNIVIDMLDRGELTFSEHFGCSKCGISLEELSPRAFSFNSTYGACPACNGLGERSEADPELILDLERSLCNGGIIPWPNADPTNSNLGAVANKYGIDIHAPLKECTEDQLHILLHGTNGERISFDYTNSRGQVRKADWPYEGIITWLTRMYKDGNEGAVFYTEQYMTSKECPDCKGTRLKPESRAVTVGGLNIAEVSNLSISDAENFFNGLELTDRELFIAHQVLREIRARLGFLANVGLEYLTLDRAARTLSGGESQRIRLATQIGSSLAGVIYILDEPSIGLHQRDNHRLLGALKALRDIGNTVIVVEHDEDTMRAADHIIDIGPGPGIHGGRVVAAGTSEQLMAHPESITGQFLSGARSISVPETRRKLLDRSITIRGARQNNLKNIDVEIPLGQFVCVTGVSGSGKSSLINEILYKRLAKDLNRASTKAGLHDCIEGLQHLEKVIDIDQSPIGRSPRSNPATYTGTFDLIRKLFSETPDAKARGYGQGRFSFNTKGGRCEACQGDGVVKIQMHFMPDIYVPCETCGGRRYNRETLEVKYKGKSIADVLDMTIEEACSFFSALPQISRKLVTLNDVGLGYITMGQSATTLSGGEAQRMKLAAELSRRSNGRSLYILDEPTTGLHMADVEKLLQVLHRFVDYGDTVVVIEHNLDVIKTADYVIDLGPEGGNGGGYVIAKGTPEEVAKVEGSYTGQFLRPILENSVKGSLVCSMVS